jgi:hypothetical protein
MIDPKPINSAIINPQGTDEEMLKELQRETFDYFLSEYNEETGLVADKTGPDSPASITVAGMTISVYIAGIERNFISKHEAARRILKVLKFMYEAEQSTGKNATGYKGFFYHFLKMDTGKRAWKSELSTIDTTFFIAGALSAAAYFSGDNETESAIRQLANDLYLRVDWQWALNGDTTLSHGWSPESGFLPYRWDDNYSEALLMYVLALGSPSHPINVAGYNKWTSTFQLKRVYNLDYLYAGPLFIHQFSHIWIDFRGIQDDFNRKAGFDYFENSKRATYVHREYAIENPKSFNGYGAFCWGLTASDGPGNQQLTIENIQRTFYGYLARGAPFGPDDGTVSPWAVVASLPFAPEIVIQTIRHAIERLDLKRHRLYGFDASFNPTYPEKTDNTNGWISPYRFGLNQAPIFLMIENYYSKQLWEIMKKSLPVVNGLKAAGFTCGWLDPENP